jgi:hypothetical protein
MKRRNPPQIQITESIAHPLFGTARVRAPSSPSPCFALCVVPAVGDLAICRALAAHVRGRGKIVRGLVAQTPLDPSYVDAFADAERASTVSVAVVHASIARSSAVFASSSSAPSRLADAAPLDVV